MWTQIAAFWQLAPSIGSLVVAILAVTAVPITMVLRTWISNRPAYRRALAEKYEAETERQIRQYEAETDRQLSLRELEIAQEKMRLEAKLRWEALMASRQGEICFPEAIEGKAEPAAYDEAA